MDFVNLKVAGFNVLNFFTTIDNGSNGARGADTQEDLKRQTKKLVAAIGEMDVDGVELMELENNNTTSISTLVNQLNTYLGNDGYNSVLPPVPFGADVIKNGLIYKASKVDLIDSSETLPDTLFKRPPLTQTFKLKNSNDELIVIVNHFKSKGNFGNAANGLDLDQGDGQGFYNYTRKLQA